LRRPKVEYEPRQKADESAFSRSEIAVMDRVVKECAGWTGTDLAHRTHQEGPWALVWSDADPGRPITPAMMRWLDNLPTEKDLDDAKSDLARREVAKAVKKLTGLGVPVAL
jgi:hypothetical protein